MSTENNVGARNGMAVTGRLPPGDYFLFWPILVEGEGSIAPEHVISLRSFLCLSHQVLAVSFRILSEWVMLSLRF